MPQYAIKLCHTSDQCAVANAKLRERATRGDSEVPVRAQKLGVRMSDRWC